MNFSPVYIQAISTVNPDFAYKQDEIRDFMVGAVGTTAKKASFIQKIYQGSAIDRRFSVLEDYKAAVADRRFFPKTEDLEPQPSTAKRNALFCTEANALSLKAAKQLFEDVPGVKPQEITHLITVSCTGFSAPGFDFHLVKELSLNSAVHRFHIGFMGCFAAFPALKLAQSLCRSQPQARVLIVDVELCTLHFQKLFEPDIVVANALFADGAAAILVSCDTALKTVSGFSKLQLHDFSSQIIPESENDMAWIIGEHGFDMKLSSYVPRLIESHIQDILHRLFDQAGWKKDELELWAIHPGGRAILDKATNVLGLDADDLKASYETLRDYGNMSSVTVFFVLQNILRQKRTGKLFSCAFGPGLTVESALMEVV